VTNLKKEPFIYFSTPNDLHSSIYFIILEIWIAVPRHILTFSILAVRVKGCNIVSCRSRWPRCLRRRSRPFVWRDRGLEPLSGHGCVFLCSYIVLSCVVRGLYNELITSRKESYHVCNKIREAWKGRAHGPMRAGVPQGKEKCCFVIIMNFIWNRHKALW
jgi:hypothetical protein